MARTAYVSLWFLVVLTGFAQCVLSQIGQTYVHNSASFDVTHWKYVTHANGSLSIIQRSTLAQGATEEFTIAPDVTCVRTSYFQLPAETIGQVVLDWCTTGMPFDCLPNCFWIVDDTGFSVANNKYSVLRFVAPWGSDR